MKPCASHLSLALGCDHTSDLQGKAQDMGTLGFAAECPALDRSCLGNAAYSRDYRRSQQINEFENHLFDGNGHRVLVRNHIGLRIESKVGVCHLWADYIAP